MKDNRPDKPSVEDQLKKLRRKTDDQSAQLASLWDLWEEMMLNKAFETKHQQK